jgi:hypothetical protein
MVTGDDARRLVRALCPLAGDEEAASTALLSLAHDADPDQQATLLATALHVVFVECLSKPVPVPVPEEK